MFVLCVGLVRCVLFVVCSLLFGVCRVLVVVFFGWMMIVVSCWLLLVSVVRGWLLFVVCGLLFADWLLFVSVSRLVRSCLFVVVCCLLFVVCLLLWLVEC